MPKGRVHIDPKQDAVNFVYALSPVMFTSVQVRLYFPRLLLLLVPIGGVLAWVRILVIQSLGHPVVSTCNQSAQQRTQPVNPVIARERAGDNIRAERADRIERTAGEWDTCRDRLSTIMTNNHACHSVEGM